MAMDGLPEVVSPSGRVSEQLLQAAPILKRRRRRNRECFVKKGSCSEGFQTRGKYRRRGGVGRTHRAARRPPGAAQGGAAPGTLLGPWWWPSFPLLVLPEGSFML